MTVRVMVLAALVLTGSTDAMARDIGGKYRVEGTAAHGGRYTGTVEITMVSDIACRIVWSDGFKGICMLDGDSLAVAFDMHGRLGIGSYRILADGAIEGSFFDDYQKGGLSKDSGVGKEKLTPLR